MKKILVPTDFSPVADNAMDFALGIAEAFDSEIFLYHAFHFHKKVDYNWDFPPNEQPYVKNLEKQMKYARLRFAEKIAQQKITVHTTVKECSLHTLFREKVVDNYIDLIVMGSKGATGLGKVIFGSVAVTALETSKVPILIIPPNFSFSAFRKIALAVDHNDISAGTLTPLEKIARQFSSEVSILSVQTNTATANTQRDLSFLKDIDAVYTEIPKKNSVNESIKSFMEENEFDLLCMVRREKGFFDKLLGRSFTKSRAYMNKTPFLVLPEKAKP
ncbi:MAG: universal stress protein [Bacteroidetes bacterium]|nr:universal stress protein [Bacteroidota bacterium]